MPYLPILPTWVAINAADDPTPTGLQDIRTGQTVYGGALNLGDYFDMTEKEANGNSDTDIGTLHAGRYRRVKVDSGATAANVKTGTIGLMVAGGQPQLNLVTSYDKGIVGAHPVVFLNSITPGNYGFVQELGIATVLCGSSIQKASPASGDLLEMTTAGVVDDKTTQTVNQATIGVALAVPGVGRLIIAQLNLPVLQG
jgi:hypothetical protein